MPELAWFAGQTHRPKEPHAQVCQGSEMKILGAYDLSRCFTDFAEACAQWCGKVNARPHRGESAPAPGHSSPLMEHHTHDLWAHRSGAAPTVRLTTERGRLCVLPEDPYLLGPATNASSGSIRPSAGGCAGFDPGRAPGFEGVVSGRWRRAGDRRPRRRRSRRDRPPPAVHPGTPANRRCLLSASPPTTNRCCVHPGSAIALWSKSTSSSSGTARTAGSSRSPPEESPGSAESRQGQSSSPRSSARRGSIEHWRRTWPRG